MSFSIKKLTAKEISWMLSVCLISFFFFIKIYLTLDPDFGWYLRLGEYARENGLPYLEPFSYAMPNYPFIDHEWLSNVFISISYYLLGWTGLAFVFGVICIATLVVSTHEAKGRYKSILSFTLAGSLINFVSVRPQSIAWLLFTILIYVLAKERLHNKLVILVPLIMVLWASFHGSFFIGIFLLGSHLLKESIKDKKISISILIVFFLGLLMTLISPYGFDLWKVVFVHINSSWFLRQTIDEWGLGVQMFSLPILFLVSLIFSCIYLDKRNIYDINYIILLIFLIQALLVKKYIPFFCIYGCFFLSQRLEKLENDLSLIPSQLSKLVISLKFLSYILSILFILTAMVVFLNIIRFRSTFYPKDTLLYLQQHAPLQGNIFADYDWGGYLLWKLPSKKIFVDGRIPLQEWETPPPFGEKSAFKTYLNILKGTADYKIIFNKYDIKYVLITNNLSKLGGKEKIFRYSNLLNTLLDDGWEIIIEDEGSILLQKLK